MIEDAHRHRLAKEKSDAGKGVAVKRAYNRLQNGAHSSVRRIALSLSGPTLACVRPEGKDAVTPQILQAEAPRRAGQSWRLFGALFSLPRSPRRRAGIRNRQSRARHTPRKAA